MINEKVICVYLKHFHVQQFFKVFDKFKERFIKAYSRKIQKINEKDSKNIRERFKKYSRKFKNSFKSSEKGNDLMVVIFLPNFFEILLLTAVFVVQRAVGSKHSIRARPFSPSLTFVSYFCFVLLFQSLSSTCADVAKFEQRIILFV